MWFKASSSGRARQVMRFFHPPAILLAIVLIGCGKEQAPLTSHGKPVVHWLEELNKTDPKARKKAVVALGHVGTADPAALPALIGAVKDRDAAVRSKAILALLNIGPDAKDALAALDDARKDKDATVRSYAAKAMERIQGGKLPVASRNPEPPAKKNPTRRRVGFMRGSAPTAACA